MKSIRIFIASSNELEYERLHIDSLILQLNSKFFKDIDVEVEPIKWEFLENIDKQKEYNQKLATCDICIVLFWNKIGPYTKEEFNLAYQLSEEKNIPYLYVYFKEPVEKDTVTDDFCVFKEEYQDVYKRYPSKVFENIDALKSNLILRLLDYLHIEHRNHIKYGVNNDTRVYLKDVEIADLRNVPCFYNNDDYSKTINELDEIEKNLELYPASDYLLKKSAELQAKKKELEYSIFDCAAQIARNLTATSSKRLQESTSLLEQGKYKEALEILNEKTIDCDLDTCLKYNEIASNLSISVKNTIIDLINQYETRCRTICLSRNSVKQFEEDIKKLNRKIIDVSYKINDESYISEKYEHYVFYLRHIKDYDEAIIQINTVLKYCKNVENQGHWMYYLALCYKECGNFTKAIEIFKNAIPLLKGLYLTFGKQYALIYAQMCADFGSTLSSIRGNEQSASAALFESHNVFKDNQLTDLYSYVHATESLVQANLLLRDYEAVSKNLNELKDAIDTCSDNDGSAMESLKLRYVIIRIQKDELTGELSVPRMLIYIKDANAHCDNIRGKSGYREVLWEYYMTMIAIATKLLSSNDGINTFLQPSLWINKAKSELNIVEGWYDKDILFAMKINLAIVEIASIIIGYHAEDARNVLNVKFKCTLNLITDYVNEKHIINAPIMNFLDVTLYLGQYDEYMDDTAYLIALYNKESLNLLESSRKIMDFKIRVYQCCYINNDTSLFKVLYDEYKAKYSLIQFLNSYLYINIHAFFLNAVIYYVLIGEEKLDEALSLIDDVLSIYAGKHEDCLDTKAEVLYRMGRTQEALSIIGEVYKINPNYYPSGNDFLYNELSKSEEWPKVIKENQPMREDIEVNQNDVVETKVITNDDSHTLPKYSRLTRIEKDGKYGFADELGVEVIPCNWDWAASTFYDDMVVVQDSNKKWGYIDKNGKNIIPCQWEEALSFHEGLAAVKNDYNEWGYINKDNNVIIPFQWKSASIFLEGLAYVKDSDNHYGYIDTTGMVVISCKWKWAKWFSEGLAAVQDANNKWGYIDKTGNLVIPCQWDLARDFKGGIAQVYDKKKFLYIDKEGKAFE